jgi:hypothetical protein
MLTHETRIHCPDARHFVGAQKRLCTTLRCHFTIEIRKYRDFTFIFIKPNSNALLIDIFVKLSLNWSKGIKMAQSYWDIPSNFQSLQWLDNPIQYQLDFITEERASCARCKLDGWSWVHYYQNALCISLCH